MMADLLQSQPAIAALGRLGGRPVPLMARESVEVLAIFEALRANSKAPPWPEADLLAFAPYLPRAALLEPEDPAHLWVRLFGTDLLARVGAELTGINAVDTVTARQRDDQIAAYRRFLERPCVMVARNLVHTRLGPSRRFELLSLPLLGAGGAIARLLAFVFAYGASADEAPEEPADIVDRVILAREFYDL